jgi:hypothetical protein
MDILQLLCSRHYCPANIPQLDCSSVSSHPPLVQLNSQLTLCQLTTELVAPVVFKVTPRQGPYRKHRSSIVACMFFATGTFLPNCSLLTGCITPLFIRLSRNNCIATAVHATILYDLYIFRPVTVATRSKA